MLSASIFILPKPHLLNSVLSSSPEYGLHSGVPAKSGFSGFHFSLGKTVSTTKPLGLRTRRIPVKTAVGFGQKSAFSVAGALAAPSTAYVYDWNMLPIGQQLWLKWLETLKDYPPLQAPASYNLTQVEEQVKSAGGHASE